MDVTTIYIQAAVNSPMDVTTIFIGYWNGQGMAIFNFGERKLVWEILEKDEPKRKMEILWSHITALGAQLYPVPALRIELGSPPSYYEEYDGVWREIDDFTGDEAETHRIHYVFFPPGELDKPLEKLLELDENLLKLSKKPFPELPGSSRYIPGSSLYFKIPSRARCSNSKIPGSSRQRNYSPSCGVFTSMGNDYILPPLIAVDWNWSDDEQQLNDDGAMMQNASVDNNSHD